MRVYQFRSSYSLLGVQVYRLSSDIDHNLTHTRLAKATRHIRAALDRNNSSSFSLTGGELRPARKAGCGGLRLQLTMWDGLRVCIAARIIT